MSARIPEIPVFDEDSSPLGQIDIDKAEALVKAGAACWAGRAGTHTRRLILRAPVNAEDAMEHVTAGLSDSWKPGVAALQTHYTTHLESGLKCYAQKRVVGSNSRDSFRRWREDKPFAAQGRRAKGSAVPRMDPVATVPDLLPARPGTVIANERPSPRR